MSTTTKNILLFIAVISIIGIVGYLIYKSANKNAAGLSSAGLTSSSSPAYVQQAAVTKVTAQQRNKSEVKALGNAIAPGVGGDIVISVIENLFPHAFSTANTHENLLKQIAAQTSNDLNSKVLAFIAYCQKYVPIMWTQQTGQDDSWACFSMVKEMFVYWYNAQDGEHLTQGWINSDFASTLSTSTQKAWNNFMEKYVLPGAKAEGHEDEFKNYFISNSALSLDSASQIF